MAEGRDHHRRLRGGDEQVASSKEWLIAFLLVCMEEDGSLGRDLEEKIEEAGLREVRPAEMYRTLSEMEREGLISTEPGGDGPLWESPGFPWRKYRIMEPGKAYLEFWADYLELHQKPMDLFLQMYERRFGRLESLLEERDVTG